MKQENNDFMNLLSKDKLSFEMLCSYSETRKTKLQAANSLFIDLNVHLVQLLSMSFLFIEFIYSIICITLHFQIKTDSLIKGITFSLFRYFFFVVLWNLFRWRSMWRLSETIGNNLHCNIDTSLLKTNHTFNLTFILRTLATGMKGSAVANQQRCKID